MNKRVYTNSDVSFSIIIANAHSCNMNCRYCAGADEMKTEHEFSEPYPINWDKLISEMKRSPYLKINDDGSTNIGHIEIWGGEPLLYFDRLKEICDGLYDRLKIKLFFFSTNGILLANKKIFDWIMDDSKYIVRFQLSHDGLGQWIRSGSFDPLYSDSTRDNLITLANTGHFGDINCVLNKLNPSPIDNISYFNKWMSDYNVHLNTIQLNHMQDTPTVINHLINPHTKEEYNNISLNLEGTSLSVYIHEIESLFIEMFIAGKYRDADMAPYSYWIEKFCRSFGGYITSKDDKTVGSCRNFSRGLTDFNFSIDTLGNYCECILYDSTQQTPNHECNQPEYCKSCEFYNYKTCNGCSDQWYMPIKNSEECQFRKEYARLQERIAQIDEALSSKNKCGCSNNKKGE